MLVDEIERAIRGAQRGRLAEIGAAMWKSWAAGGLDDDAAEHLAELIRVRQVTAPAAPAPRRHVGSRPRSSSSLERRRSWAAGGWLPPTIACRFSTGEAAVLALVVREITVTGRCALPVNAVAARAGTCATTVRNALRQARTLGLVAIEVRRVAYDRNLPNLISLLSREMQLWARTRARAEGRGGGCKSAMATPNLLLHRPAPHLQVEPLRVWRGENGRSDGDHRHRLGLHSSKTDWFGHNHRESSTSGVSR